MKSTNKIIKIDISTYILILLAFLGGYLKNISIIIFIVFIHELGHIFFFKLFSIKIKKINIYPFGGMTTVNTKIHERIYKKILCSLGGIIFQILLLTVTFLLKDYLKLSTYKLLIYYNKIILIFNLLPIIPLDGSKILFNILLKYISFKKANVNCTIISIISLILFILFNIKFKINNITIIVFLTFHTIKTIKDYEYIMNNFFLERYLYNHYYDEIIYNKNNLNDMKITKYYYFKNNKNYISEKNYLRKKYIR